MVNPTKLKRVVLLCMSITLAVVLSGNAQTSGGPFAVNVTVMDTTGARVMNDTLQFIDSLDGINQSFTSAAGFFTASLPSGSYTVRIIAAGYPMQYYAGYFTTIMPMYKLQVYSDTVLPIRLTIGSQGTTAGTGVVSGVVYDSSGIPLANSSITIVSGTSAPVNAVTAANGAFSVTVPATGTGLYMLRIYSPSYPMQYWTPTGTSSTPPTSPSTGLFSLAPYDTFRVNVRLSMSPAGGSGTQTMHVVHVSVMDTTGMLVMNDTVMFIDSMNDINQSIASATGTSSVSLPAGAYMVRIIAPGYPMQYYAGFGTTVQPGYKFQVYSDTVLPIRLTIRQQGAPTSYALVSGFVFDSTGKPVVNSGITVISASGTVAPVNTVCDSTGYFFSTVPVPGSGVYMIMIHSPAYPPQYWSPSGPITAPTTANGGMFYLTPNDSFRITVRLSAHPGSSGTVTQHAVRVRVLNDTGGVAVGCDVQFIDTSNYIREGFTNAMSDLSMSLPSSIYQVRLSCQGFPVQYYNVPVNSASPMGRIFVSSDTLLTFTLTHTPMGSVTTYGIVSGSIQDSVGRPVNNAKVTLTQVGTNIVSAGMMADSAGRFFASVPAMPHTILVYAPMYPSQYWTPNGTTSDPMNNTSFAVTSNDTVMVTVRLSTHPGSGGTVYVPQHGNGFVLGHVFVKATNQAAAGVMVIAVPRDTTIPNPKLYVGQNNMPYSATVKSDGSYRIGGLPPGFYWVYQGRVVHKPVLPPHRLFRLMPLHCGGFDGQVRHRFRRPVRRCYYRSIDVQGHLQPRQHHRVGEPEQQQRQPEPVGDHRKRRQVHDNRSCRRIMEPFDRSEQGLLHRQRPG